MSEINTPMNINDNDEISLKDLVIKIKEWVAFLKTKLKLISLTVCMGSFIGIVLAFNIKPEYKAELTFVLEEDKGGSGLSGALGLASSFGLDLGGAGGGMFSSTNIMELMKSRLIIEKTLLNPVVKNNDTISLAEYYLQINKTREDWNSKPTLQNIQFLPNADRTKFSIQQDSILQTIYASIVENYIDIKQKDKKITIITLSVKSKNELFAKLFCENLSKETSEFYIETKSKKAKLNVETLQKQADSVRNELDNAINGVATATDNVYNLNPTLVIRTAPSKRKQVDVQTYTAILTQLLPQLEMSKVALRKETPLIQTIDKPILPLTKIKLGKLKSLILGGFLSGFLTVLYLIFSQMYKKLIN